MDDDDVQFCIVADSIYDALLPEGVRNFPKSRTLIHEQPLTHFFSFQETEKKTPQRC